MEQMKNIGDVLGACHRSWTFCSFCPCGVDSGFVCVTFTQSDGVFYEGGARAKQGERGYILLNTWWFCLYCEILGEITLL